MSEQNNLNQISKDTGDFSSSPSVQEDSQKLKKIKTIHEILDKKQSEIIREAVKSGVPDADIVKLFSLLYQQDEIDDKTILSNYELLGFSIGEVKVSEVKLSEDKDYFYQYNKILILLTTPYENVIDFEITTGKIKVPKEIEVKLAPVIEEIKMMKRWQELDIREKELKEKEEKLIKREQALRESEEELGKREETLRSKEAELKQLGSEIAKIVGLTCYDEEDP